MQSGQLPLGAADIDQVLQCLKAALGADQAIRKSAEGTLQSLEARPGFCSCLAEILTKKEAEHSARWLAAVHFKNSLTRNWRPRLRKAGISEEERQHLRVKLLTLIDQEDAQLAIQVAIVFAKVARADYPRDWPTLFEQLTSRLQAGSVLTTRRVYLALHNILKELSSKRLAADQRSFAQVAQLLLEPYWHQWRTATELVVAHLPLVAEHQEQPQAVALALERWLLQLKGLRRMVMFGFQSDATSLQSVPAVHQIAPALLQALQQLLPLRRQFTGPASQLTVMLDRCGLKLAKTLGDLLSVHPWSMYESGVIQPALEFFCSQLTLRSSQPSDAWYMLCMVFIHRVLKCSAFKGRTSSTNFQISADQEDAVKVRAADIQAGLQAFWHSDRLQLLCSALVQSFLPLTARDLQQWADTPEEFHHECETSAWEEHLRSCAQVLLGVLMEDHRQQLAPVLVAMLQGAEEACPPGRSATLAGPRTEGVPALALAKEAIYNAVGTCAYELHDFLDFPSWFGSALLQELGDQSEAAKPLRRRALLLVGAWTPKLRESDRPAVYRAVLHMLGDRDAALQLAAVATLQSLVDDWDFREDQFVDFAGPAFAGLTPVLQSAEDYDAQLQVFNLINSIIDRLGDSMKPFAAGFMQLLPQAWEAADGHSLLRMQILISLQKLVHALGMESWTCYPLLASLLPFCTDINQPDELNLLEDGLQLWAVALCNAPRPEPQLLHLFPNLVAIMERSTGFSSIRLVLTGHLIAGALCCAEHIQPAMQIATSCILLGGADFLQQHGQNLTRMLSNLIGNVKERGMLLIIPVVELVLQVAPQQGPALLRDTLQRLLAVTLSGQETPVVEAAAMSVFARLLLQDGSMFMDIFTAGQSISNSDWPELFMKFLDRWLDRFDIIASDRQRKLNALALCVLLHVQLAPLLQRLSLLVSHITSVWCEVEGNSGTEDRPHFGYDFFNATRFEDTSSATLASEEAEGEITRRRQLHEQDPVNCIKLSSFLQDNIHKSLALNGEGFKTAIAQLDPSLVSELQKAMAQAPEGYRKQGTDISVPG